MEYADGPDLFDYIKEKGVLTETEAASIFGQLVLAIEYMHSKNIVHRDIKPENIIIKKNGNIKLIDFGLSCTVKEDQLLSDFCGSPNFSPPEMILKIPYNGKHADIWSAGVTLYCMTHGDLPFIGSIEDNELFQTILKCNPAIGKQLSNDCQNLLKRILSRNPGVRISISEMKYHTFVESHLRIKESFLLILKEISKREVSLFRLLGFNSEMKRLIRQELKNLESRCHLSALIRIISQDNSFSYNDKVQFLTSPTYLKLIKDFQRYRNPGFSTSNQIILRKNNTTTDSKSNYRERLLRKKQRRSGRSMLSRNSSSKVLKLNFDETGSKIEHKNITQNETQGSSRRICNPVLDSLRIKPFYEIINSPPRRNSSTSASKKINLRLSLKNMAINGSNIVDTHFQLQTSTDASKATVATNKDLKKLFMVDSLCRNSFRDNNHNSPFLNGLRVTNSIHTIKSSNDIDISKISTLMKKLSNKNDLIMKTKLINDRGMRKQLFSSGKKNIAQKISSISSPASEFKNNLFDPTDKDIVLNSDHNDSSLQIADTSQVMMRVSRSFKNLTENTIDKAHKDLSRFSSLYSKNRGDLGNSLLKLITRDPSSNLTKMRVSLKAETSLTNERRNSSLLVSCPSSSFDSTKLSMQLNKSSMNSKIEELNISSTTGKTQSEVLHLINQKLKGGGINTKLSYSIGSITCMMNSYRFFVTARGKLNNVKTFLTYQESIVDAYPNFLSIIRKILG